LLAFLDHAVGERFLRAEHKDTLLVETDPEILLDRLASHQHRDVPKWIDREPQVPNTRSPASPSPGRM
jgi:predicted Rossmann-fold nucleotide-binding protein